MNPINELNETEKERILREVQAGNVEALMRFKETHPNIHWCELRYKRTGDTVLHVAARLGHLNIIEYLLINYESFVDFKDRDDKTALHEAAQFAQFGAIKTLLNHKANVNALKRADWTPLMLACTKIQAENSYKSVELLLERGALVNYKNKDGWTTLHIICREGSCEILNLLIEHGLDVFERTKNGRSALHVAALHGHLDVVKMLLQLGLGVNFTDNCGNTALHEAALGGSLSVCDSLLSNGCADLNVVNNFGFGVLHLAASVGNVDIINYLASDLSVDVNSRSSSGLTPLHCAARKKFTEAFDVLVSLGANIDARDNFDRCASDYLQI